jgi:alpha-N-arabinofuranosidase
MTSRREFVRNVVMGASALPFARHARLAAALDSADSRIEILLDEPLGTISPEIYGHFTETPRGLHL